MSWPGSWEYLIPGFCAFLFFTLIFPLAKLFTWVELGFAPCSTVNNLDIYITLFNKEVYRFVLFCFFKDCVAYHIDLTLRMDQIPHE